MSFSILRAFGSKDQAQVFRFDFDSDENLDGFWLVSKFGTFERNSELIKIKDGSLILYSSDNEPMPMFLSKPLDVPPGYVIQVKRKVRITKGDSVLAGGLALYQTNDEELIPRPHSGQWASAIGEGIGLVEYSYDLYRKEKRPGKNVFRLLAADWEVNDNYELLKPMYDEWFEEELSFDTRTHTLHYRVNDRDYYLGSYQMDKNAARVLMHSYGTGNDNKIEIDYIEITLKNKNSRR